MRDRAREVVTQNRAVASSPSTEKVPPEFNTAQLAELCGIDRNKLEHRRRKGGLPDGREEGRRRLFSLQDTQEWVSEFRVTKSKRNFNEVGSVRKAVVIAAGNFKGGVGKTTTAATLAQGLSLRGHKVLIIDTDPQGSITSLMGVAPETLADEDTVLDVVSGDSSSLANAIRPTYWSNIHLIGAGPRISAAQFSIPARAAKGGMKFWSVLRNGLDEDILDHYDAVIIDTPPCTGLPDYQCLLCGRYPDGSTATIGYGFCVFNSILGSVRRPE